jgi:hypothetical protein
MPVYSNYGPRDSQVMEVGDVGFAKLNQRLRPDQLGPGEVAVSINGRMEVDGAWQPRKGIEKLGNPLTANTAVLTLPFYCYGSKSISSATRSTTTVTVTTSTAHGFTTSTIVGIAGLTGSVDPNGNRLITVTGADTFTFTIDGATGSETYGGTGTAGAPYIEDSVVTGVFGSCVFSDPSDDNAEYIIMAADQNALAIDLTTGASTEIDYPAGITLSAPCELLQCFGKVLLFREGLTALEWNGTLSGSPAFTLVANGAYAANSYYDAAGNTVIADGVATVTAASHGLSVGQEIWVVDNGTTLLSETEPYQVATVPGSGSFTVRAQVPDATATLVVWTKRVAAGAGYMHMPAPAWGVYHQRRLWVPYAYLSSGSSGTPTITDRDIRDEIVASDIKDSDTYDRLANQFRSTAGTADYLVGCLPFAEDNLLIFNRNSIHLATGISGSLADVRLQLITAELGCVARRSICQVGNQVLFLSDNGLYGVEFGDLYNLRGAGLPLSAPVDPIIKRINEDHAAGCVGIYHNNRYYLAIPLDSSTDNNALLIYNFLNAGWESLDTISNEAWGIQNLLTAGAGDLNKLYAVSANGGVHIVDSREDDVDRLALFAGVSATTYAISSSLSSRQYTMGQIDRKTFRDFEVHLESSASNASNASFGIELENPDYSGTLTTVSDLLGTTLAVSEDASLRGRVGNKRGYGMQLAVTPTAGRPKVRAIRVAATVTNPAQVQAT